MRSSRSIYSRSTICALTTPYSRATTLITSSSRSCSTVEMTSMPPCPIRAIEPFGGRPSSRSPAFSSSFRMTCGADSQLSTMCSTRSAARMTESTSRPRPAPRAAPSISPGRSSSWMVASRCLSMPGITSSVVKAYAAVSLSAAVSELSSVDLPTLGSPTMGTVASPALRTL